MKIGNEQFYKLNQVEIYKKYFSFKESKSFLFAADKAGHAENLEQYSKDPWNY